MFLDGFTAASGQHFNENYKIPGTGRFVIGQENSHNMFVQSKSFQGRMSQLNIWSFEMNRTAIKALSRQCMLGSVGSVVAWRQLRHNLHGLARVVETETCEPPGTLLLQIFTKICRITSNMYLLTLNTISANHKPYHCDSPDF